MSTWAVIAAAGSGSRMGTGARLVSGDRSKVLLPIEAGLSPKQPAQHDTGATNPGALELSLRALRDSGCISGCVLAVRPHEAEEVTALAAAIFTLSDRATESWQWKVVPGGENRQASVFACLQAVPESVEYVLIHDAARPFCPPELIQRVLAETKRTGACIPAVPVKATLKRVITPTEGSNPSIAETVSREMMREAQTPQGFRRSLILDAHLRAQHDAYLGTDDSQLVERLGTAVCVVEGSDENIKITTPADMQYAAFLRRNRLGDI